MRKKEIKEFIERHGIIAVLAALKEICEEKVADSNQWPTPSAILWKPFWLVGASSTAHMIELFHDLSAKRMEY